MQFPSISQMIPILQTAIGPVILISGIGLLLLTMTNRLGRVIDRARVLASGFPDIKEDGNREKVEAQLSILWKRAGLLRLAITLASMSALSAAILIIALFFSALWKVDSAWFIGILFIACMLCLIGSLAAFIHDLNQSLAALKLELDWGK
jgi:Na+/melibiose symporter-like transporter